MDLQRMAWRGIFDTSVSLEKVASTARMVPTGAQRTIPQVGEGRDSRPPLRSRPLTYCWKQATERTVPKAAGIEESDRDLACGTPIGDRQQSARERLRVAPWAWWDLGWYPAACDCAATSVHKRPPQRGHHRQIRLPCTTRHQAVSPENDTRTCAAVHISRFHLPDLGVSCAECSQKRELGSQHATPTVSSVLCQA